MNSGRSDEIRGFAVRNDTLSRPCRGTLPRPCRGTLSRPCRGTLPRRAGEGKASACAGEKPCLLEVTKNRPNGGARKAACLPLSRPCRSTFLPQPSGGVSDDACLPLPRLAGEGGPAGPGEGVVPYGEAAKFPPSDARKSLPVKPRCRPRGGQHGNLPPVGQGIPSTLGEAPDRRGGKLPPVRQGIPSTLGKIHGRQIATPTSDVREISPIFSPHGLG
jgi:hypothetical protein